MNIFLSTWVLLVAGLVFALPMIHMRVKDHTDLADEVVYVILLVTYLRNQLIADFIVHAWTTTVAFWLRRWSRTDAEPPI